MSLLNSYTFYTKESLIETQDDSSNQIPKEPVSLKKLIDHTKPKPKQKVL